VCTLKKIKSPKSLILEGGVEEVEGVLTYDMSCIACLALISKSKEVYPWKRFGNSSQSVLVFTIFQNHVFWKLCLQKWCVEFRFSQTFLAKIHFKKIQTHYPKVRVVQATLVKFGVPMFSFQIFPSTQICVLSILLSTQFSKKHFFQK